MSEEEIAEAKIVTHAAALEVNGFLLVKIATGEPGSLEPIRDYQQVQFEAYMNEIRDAGVRVEVVNQAGDYFDCRLEIFYDSMLFPSDVEAAVKTAIKNYLQGLPFNGEYSNMALVDAVQVVDGVRVVTLENARTGTPADTIRNKTTPAAGYFDYNPDNIHLIMRPHAT